MVSKYKIYVQDNARRLRPYIQDLICGVLASSVVVILLLISACLAEKQQIQIL
jgi:hypothetical protein